MKFDLSQAWHERASRVIPGGVNSGVRSLTQPVPRHFTHAKDAHIWDVDGNEYIDYSLGQGPMFLGHTPEKVIDAVQRQAERGIVFAGQCEDEVVAAELLVKHIACAEKVRFCTTGSEAVHAALRLARSATGRNKVLRFEGHYHGWLDTIAWNHATRDTTLGPPEDPVMRPSSLGQRESDAADLVLRPWNNALLLQQTFDEMGDSLAAVICDPFASAAGLIPAEQSFLVLLREQCVQHNVILIFDEVITGLRVAPGGAQELYDVTPDLATFAKALGAGMPVAALAGRADLMDHFTTGTVHSGTYNSNPLCMAGTRAVLEILLEDDAAFKQAWTAGERLMSGLDVLAQKYALPMQLRGVPTVFSTSFLPPDSAPVTDMRSAQQADAGMLQNFWLALRDHGVQMTCFGIWFVSTVHNDVDIDDTLAAADAAMAEVKG